MNDDLWAARRPPKGAARLRMARIGPSIALLAVGLVFGQAVVVGAAVTSSAARGRTAASTAAWAIQSSPNVRVPGNVQVTSAACASASTCFAVGEQDGTVGSVSLIEKWNGSAWSVVDAPDPTGAVSGRLNAIACADSSTCFAVGSGSGGTLVKRWNGTSWSVMPFPQVDRSPGLTGVSCPSSTTCFAVGWGFAPRAKSVIARWDGTTWSIVSSAVLQGEYVLNALACSGVTSCFAVGQTFVGGEPGEALVMQWDGNSWSRAQSSVTTLSQQYFRGVACPSVTMCFAIGSMTAEWDGSTWSDTAQAPAPGNLTAVACASVSRCYAVGVFGFIDQWDGTVWSTVVNPPPNATDGTGFFGVTCESESECFAVGFTGQPYATTTTIEQWNGTGWSALAAPTSSPTTGVLSAVTCRKNTSCVAVGRNAVGSTTPPPDDSALIERWNGTRWSIDPVPSASDQSRRLAGVVCPSASRCFAVGTQYALDAVSPKSVTQQWDGHGWTVVASVTPNNVDRNELFGTTCANESRCYAVGYQTANGKHVPMIESWNGANWSYLASPSVNLGSLYGASCPSSTTCFAVGLKNGEGTPTALVEQSTGGKWSVMTNPNPAGARFSQLASVACPNVKSCFAVGRYSATDNSRKPLVEQWNGKHWQPVAAAIPSGATKPELSSIACPSTTSCTAVGKYTIGKTTEPLVERWNGARWTVETSAVPGDARSTLLSGVACTSTTACVAVGNTIIENTQKTFVERHS